MKYFLVSTTAIVGVMGVLGSPAFASPNVTLAPTSFVFGNTSVASGPVLVGLTAGHSFTVSIASTSTTETLAYSIGGATSGFSYNGTVTSGASLTPLAGAITTTKSASIRTGTLFFAPANRANSVSAVLSLTGSSGVATPAKAAITAVGTGVAAVGNISSPGAATTLTSVGTLTVNMGTNPALVGTTQTQTVVVSNVGNGDQAAGGSAGNAAANPTNLNSSNSSGTAPTGYWSTTGSGNFGGATGALGTNSNSFVTTTGSAINLPDTSTQVFTYAYAPTITTSGNVTQGVSFAFYNGTPGTGTPSSQTNQHFTDTVNLVGKAVAAIASVTPSGVANYGTTAGTYTNTLGYALVNSTLNTASIKVLNSGNGDTSGLSNTASTPSNLNSGPGTGGTTGAGGIWSSASNAFQGTTGAGSGGTNGTINGAGAVINLGDSASQSLSYTVDPSQKGVSGSATVGFSFYNGNPNGTNTGASLNSTIGWTGVAPIVTTSGGSTVGRLGSGGGTTAAATVTNTGNGNLSGLGDPSNLHGTLGAASGAFTGSGSGAFDLADHSVNPSATNQTSSNYTYVPSVGVLNYSTNHDVTTTGSASYSTTNGSPDGLNNPVGSGSITLSGTSVGPVYSSNVQPWGARAAGTYGGVFTNTVASAGYANATPYNAGPGVVNFGLVHGTATQGITISNVSTDPGSLALTGLTLVAAKITGVDAGFFHLDPSFIAELGTTLAEGSSFLGDVDFTAGPGGHYDATLAIQTDENAALGGAGDIFYYTLVAQVAPEPASMALLGAGLVGLGIIRRRRRRS